MENQQRIRILKVNHYLKFHTRNFHFSLVFYTLI